MTSQREIGLSFLALALNFAAMPALAHPAEPLVETRLTDPDPEFVPAPAEKMRSARLKRRSDENPTLDQAFENLGRVAGQAAQVMQQRGVSSADMQARARAALQRARQDSPPQ